MTAHGLAGLRALAESLPPDTPVPVPAGMLRELLGAEGNAAAGESLPAELTQRVASLEGRLTDRTLRRA